MEFPTRLSVNIDSHLGPGPGYNVEGSRKACANATFRFPVPPYNIIWAKRCPDRKVGVSFERNDAFSFRCP